MDFRWPWQKRETRSQPYTDAIIGQILAAVSDTTEFKAGSTATEAACKGLWSRAFAVAEVKPAGSKAAALSAVVLSTMAENLFDRGESVWTIDVADGAVVLTGASGWTVHGGGLYEVDVPEPDTVRTRFLPSDGVVHLRINRPAQRPWTGQSPIGGQSGSTGTLLAAIEGRLAEEAGGTMGHVIPVPEVDDGTDNLQTDIGKLKGRTILVPTTSGAWVEGPASTAPRTDWQPKRLGADPPAGLVQLRGMVCADIAAAGGVPPPLLAIGSDGTSRRESWRQLLYGLIEPLGALILPELRDKLDEPKLGLDFSRLFASDLSGRARAFQGLVNGGLSVDKAAALSGLLESES